MTYLLTHTAGLLLLAAGVWLAGFVVERGGLRLDDERLRPLARICLGLGFWVAVLFALAALGALHRPALGIVAFGLGSAAAWIRLRRRPPEPTEKTARRYQPRRLRIDRVGILLGSGLAAVLVPLYVLALAPAVSWDASVYHLTLPKLFLAHQGFREVPFNVYSNWPLATELLFSAAMLVMDYVLAKLVHFGFGLLVLYGLWAGSRRFHPRGNRGRWPIGGWLAMVLFLANPVVVYELRVAYVDLAHAFFLLAGFLWMMRARGDGPDADCALFLAGLCGGLMAGVKLSGIVGAAVLAALYLPQLAAAAKSGGRGAWHAPAAAAAKSFGRRFALPVVAFWVPWLIKATWLTGNPFYPFLLGGPDWSPALGEQLAAWQSSIGMGREPLDYLLLPLRVILEGGQGYGRFDGEVGVFWIVVVPLALWAAVRHWLARRALAAAGLYFLFWAFSSQQTRLLIPVLALLALAGSVAVVELIARLPWPTARDLGYRLLVLASLVLLVWTATGGTPTPKRSRYLAAAGQALGRYLSEEGDLRSTAVHPAYAFINAELPEDARLLFLNTNQRFFCDREVIADSFFEASQIADWLAPAATVGELRELLAAEGVSHLLIAARDWGIAYPPALGEMLRDPDEIELLWSSPDGLSVVALR